MSTRVEAIEAEAMRLPAEERVRLAERLLASLSEDTAIDDVWAKEVERRIAEIECGRGQVVPAADAISRARASVK
jgi:putative addiction module component (TIGR02574 family)